MYNTKFILSNGKEIYPGYFDKEKRKELQEKFKNEKGFMWCGCRDDQKLFYRISEDLKIYPEHNNYIHNQYCSRYRTELGEVERKTGYVVNDEDGEVTAYLTFNPKNLATNDKSEKEEDNSDVGENELEFAENEAVIEKDEGIIKKQEKKEPKLNLSSLVRSINIDTFTERIMNNRNIDSKESFSKLVYFRMNKVRASRMKKTIGELSLEVDGVRFIYVPFAGAIKKEEKGLSKCYFCNTGPDGKIYNNFIFPDTMKKVVQEFAKVYGIEPNQDTMLAGFQYYKTTRSGVKYKVLGRVHLFQISSKGIYCRNIVEKETYDTICTITDEDKNIQFWIPPDDESIGGIIQIKNKKKKILLLFRTSKDERISFNETLYEPLIIGQDEAITKQNIYNIIKQMD